MGNILEKAQQDHAKETKLILDAAVEGLLPGSPEREAAFRKALDGLVAIVSEERPQPIWDFTAERTQAILAGDETAILRPIQTADADFYMNIKAQYSLLYRTIIQMGKIDNESVLKTDLFKPECFFCIIEDRQAGTSVGYIGIKDTRADIWEIAIELDGQFTHKGFGLRGIRLFLNEMHRITGKAEYQALVETDNLPSQKCFEKLGAKLIGLCSGPILKLEEEKRRFEENNLNLINDSMKELAGRLEVELRKLLSHVLDYRIKCPL